MERSELFLPKSPVVRRFADPDLQAFSELLSFFRAESSRPEFLDGVACGDRVRAHVARTCRRVFGTHAAHLDARQFDWFRRIQALLRMPKGSTILEWGGGYGLDSVFLASRGYSAVFFERTLSQIAVAEHFANRWRAERGPLEFRSILRDQSGFEPFGHVDAVLLDQVAHHIEPVEGVFAKCATILPRGGRMFLLEPNACSPVTQARAFRNRGFRTTAWATDETTGERYLRGNEHIRFPSVWNRIARRCGFELESQEHLAPLGIPFRVRIESTRLVRALAAMHVTTVYRRRV